MRDDKICWRSGIGGNARQKHPRRRGASNESIVNRGLVASGGIGRRRGSSLRGRGMRVSRARGRAGGGERIIIASANNQMQ